ncbi:RRM1_TatSF1_like and RRM2_TatSF1_like domain-containing protein barc isoform X2 [Megachile rotundata]|uniref:RRM1_TatSF1_like and RRM2_TatSF1_like domain-containing protein barc isoform X2 n=1 Tax=Megachile rotundata TaxID=143995 RepID=UPI0006152AD7|nr:PREDICTED: HIV Tat-specific factor 1 homolog isoform X2 [Megachile rotundata]
MADCQETQKTDDPMKHYEFDGQSYIYKDPASNITYKFDQEKNEWVEKKDEEKKENDSSANEAKPQEGVFGFENDTHTYTDPNDGSVYFWDKEKNAWFPKVDDDFMARYQMSYGFTDSSAGETKPAPEPEVKTKVEKEKKKVEAKRKAQDPPTWFEVDEAHNTAIYVSGLPLDITLDELTELFNKCGLIARDEKGKDKIKLYRDSNGQPKGDALCIYIKVESVDLALKILDKSQIRGKTLSVQRAKFQMKGDAYDPALKPKRKKKDKERQKKIHEKLFDWRPERPLGEPAKHERVVIIKNLFSPEDFDKEVALLLEYQQDIRSECLKCGDVRKVIIYDRHPEGVAQVIFREPAEAQACVQLLNGRWFSQRKISAEIWDGKTKYKSFKTIETVSNKIRMIGREEAKKMVTVLVKSICFLGLQRLMPKLRPESRNGTNFWKARTRGRKPPRETRSKPMNRRRRKSLRPCKKRSFLKRR